MYPADFDDENEEPTAPDEELVDFESDMIDVRDEDEEDLSPSEMFSEDRAVADVDLDNTVDEFVEVVNGRDLEGVGALLAEDVGAVFLGEATREGVIEALGDLFLRYPTLTATRGDLGPEPIVAVWLFDQEADDFEPFGYFTFEVEEAPEGLIERLEYVEELPDSDDLVVETPERSELSEWDDWSELDED